MDERDEDLNIIILDSKEKIKYLKHLLHYRSNSNKSFWLIDVSKYKGFVTAISELNFLTIDIDDDVFVFQTLKDHIDIWEIYKVSEKSNITHNFYGNWTNNYVKTFVTIEESKPWRRRQLNGYNFKVTTQISKPYITEFDNNSMKGIFGEVFEELKVINQYQYSF